MLPTCMAMWVSSIFFSNSENKNKNGTIIFQPRSIPSAHYIRLLFRLNKSSQNTRCARSSCGRPRESSGDVVWCRGESSADSATQPRHWGNLRSRHYRHLCCKWYNIPPFGAAEDQIPPGSQRVKITTVKQIKSTKDIYVFDVLRVYWTFTDSRNQLKLKYFTPLFQVKYNKWLSMAMEYVWPFQVLILI